ncbi:MAG: sulfite reductase subunit alpha [Pirellulales bacterium]
MTTAMIPESAPFTNQQRAWLNGFFAALLNAPSGSPTNGHGHAVDAHVECCVNGNAASAATLIEEETFPWHDPALPIDERLTLAVDRPLERKLMSCMAQLNCGACGYLCQSYGEAIARGEEKDLTRCTPGGSDTAKMLKKLMAEPREPATATNGVANGTVNGTATTTTNGHASAANKQAPKQSTADGETIPGTSRQNPLVAVLVENRRLTHVDAPKDTRHVVIDLGDSGLEYEAGDSLGILPMNCPQLVDETLAALGATGAESISMGDGRRKSLRQALAGDFQLTKCRPALWELLRQYAGDDVLKEELKVAASGGDDFAATADVAEALQKYSTCRPPIEAFVAALGKLQPRLYSISSSHRKHPGQVHLTVGVVQFESLGKRRHGVASHYIGVRSRPGEAVRVFVQKSRFRLPADDATPVIMVGPGTGIAPFRAFLEEREARGAKGRNWLVFGNQYIDYNFLYRDELDAWCDDDLLTRLDLAFSRDGTTKVYVQDRLRENAAELWDWLQAGAHFYICGDAKKMAVDVEGTLRDVIAKHGGLDESGAKKYLAEMQKAGRYQKDVY